MALTPDVIFPEITVDSIQPSKTYALDFNTGEIKGMVDGRKAMEQFVRKAITTIRFIHPVYTDAYGCEVRTMIGKGFTDAFLRSEIKRMITEALIYDSRINKVYEFAITPKGDEIFVKFSVDTVEGILGIEEAL